MPEQNRYKPAILGAKFAVRVSDLKDRHVVQLTCFKCGNFGMIAPDILRSRFKHYQRLLDIEDKLRCKNCGNKDMNSWSTYEIEQSP